jgi:hypothetical protein
MPSPDTHRDACSTEFSPDNSGDLNPRSPLIMCGHSAAIGLGLCSERGDGCWQIVKDVDEAVKAGDLDHSLQGR